MVKSSKTFNNVKSDTEDKQLVSTNGVFNPTHHLYRSIAQLAGLSCDKPIAVICFADDKYIHIKSSCDAIDIGEETTLDHAFCIHTMQQNEIYEVLDTTTDAHFQNLDSVKQFPHFRYYAGTPIIFNEKNVGTICVLDIKPNKLTQKQREKLQNIQQILSETLQIQNAANQQFQPFFRANRLSVLNLDSSVLIHELSQPLTALNQYITAISTFVGDNLSKNPSIKEQFIRAQNQIVRINDIIKNQKRFLNGNHENNVAPNNIVRLLDETLNLVSIELLDKNIIISRQDHKDLPTIYCDQLQIQQVLLNLILNSVRELNKQDT